MTSLFPLRESLVSDSRLGTGISKSFFYGVPTETLDDGEGKVCRRGGGKGNLLVVTTIMDSLMFAILDMRLHTGASQTSLTDSQMR